MSAPMRRGACPTLAAPMASGDGLLARLMVAELTLAQLAGLARAAAAFGNGLVEVTARGSTQVRGLTAETAPRLAAALEALGIEAPAGPPVVTGPLAGLDLAEFADPRPLAAALRGFSPPLAPKVSVVVDGGGALALDGLTADLRLRATAAGWTVWADRAPLGSFDAAGAVAAGRALLDRLSRTGGRARDLDLAPDAPPARPDVSPVGRFPLRDGVARGVAPAFGQTDAVALGALAEAARGAAGVRPAPGRALVFVGLSEEADARLLAGARALGFVTEAEDPRLRIAACAGAPACGSAWLAARAIAARLADPGFGITPPEGARLHVSGCAKRCAQPAGPAITLLGTPEGAVVTGEGLAVPDALRERLSRREVRGREVRGREVRG